MIFTFEKEKETKNTVRYKETPDDGAVPAIGTLYIQKDNLSSLDNPAKLKVEITAG